MQQVYGRIFPNGRASHKAPPIGETLVRLFDGEHAGRCQASPKMRWFPSQWHQSWTPHKTNFHLTIRRRLPVAGRNFAHKSTLG